MPTSSFTFFEAFREKLAEKAHDLGADQLKVALCAAASAPSASADAVIADVTEISYTNCSSRNVTTSSSAYSGGTYTLTLADLTLTATGGAIAAFRYVLLFNDATTGDMLIGHLDYGADVTLAETETLLIDFGTITLT